MPVATNRTNNGNPGLIQRAFPVRCRTSLDERQAVHGVAIHQLRSSRQYAVSLFPIAHHSF